MWKKLIKDSLTILRMMDAKMYKIVSKAYISISMLLYTGNLDQSVIFQ